MSLAADDGFRKGFTNPGTRTTLGAGYRAVAHRALLQKHPPEAVNFHESGELFLSWVAGLLSVWGTPCAAPPARKPIPLWGAKLVGIIGGWLWG